jgi:predicted nucleotidyltransferase
LSVRIFKLDEKEVIEKLKNWAKKFSNDENVLAVVLFGSLSRNEATPASDADILILLKESNKRFDNRIPEFLPNGIGISVDVFPYTIDEFKRSIKENWGIGKVALNEGIVIYSSKNERIENFGEWFKRYEKE